jgi:signal transduction histidine kinase
VAPQDQPRPRRRAVREPARPPSRTRARPAAKRPVAKRPGAAPKDAGTPPSRWDEVVRIQSLTVGLLTQRVRPEEVFRHVVDGAAEALGADEASLMLIDAEELRVAAARDTRRRPPGWGRPVKLGEGVAGHVAASGEPVLLNAGDDLSRFRNLAPKGDRIRSALSVPLQVAGRVVGVLNANRLTGRVVFSREDLAVLQLFASTAALAIDQATTLQRAQARTRVLDTLVSIPEAFALHPEPPAALAALLPRLGAAFHPDQALAFQGEGESLPAVAAWRSPDHAGSPDPAVALPGARLAAGVLPAPPGDPRQPVWSPAAEVTGLPAAFRLAPRRLLVPVALGPAGLRCVLLLAWRDADHVLPAEDLRMLAGLARQVELGLSHQDRAAAAGALEKEMAQARAHLVEVERLATIGQSMAGLVHDINAPLTAVITFAQLIQKEGHEAKSGERAAQIVEAAQRAQRLVRELLSMARPRPPALERVDLHALLRAAMDLERPQCSVSGIRLTAEFASQLPPVTADPHRLGQVFINLLVNARQAIDAAEKGSAITVRTQEAGERVEIHVADNGPGIPAPAKPRIFDWFFTTKPPGEGTGLGLAVSREILVAHGGNLRVEDSPGGGATFVLELPTG